VILGALCLGSEVPAQDESPAQGLKLSFESLVEDPPLALRRDMRRARLLALNVPRGEAPTPFMAPGPFRAEWEGEILLPKRDRYAFTFVGRGRFELLIDGEKILESDGARRETLSSEATRMSRGAFASEPVPTEALRHDAADAELLAANQRRQGRELFAQRHCISCHQSETFTAVGMRELQRSAPDFTDIGSRLQFPWLAAWIAAPRELRPEASMPHMLSGSAEQRGQEAADLAEYLVIHGGAPPDASEGNAVQGGQLFAQLGCVACHDFALQVEPPTISLARVASKFHPGALASFLKSPRAHDPWTRMPDFKLTAEEASNLEAFLRKHSTSSLPEVTGDPHRGSELIQTRGCLSCHEPARESEYSAPELSTLLSTEFNGGCMAETEELRGTAPDFGFAPEERAALQAFAGTGMHALGRHSGIEFASRQIEDRRCIACHSYDGSTDLWTQREELLEPLAIPPAPRPEPDVSQFRPNLSYLGARLQQPWMQKFMAGELPSPRPWMQARMPAFPEIAADLSLGMAAQHGFGAEATEHGISPTLVPQGRRLVGAAGGFSCTTCHDIGEKKASSVFEVQGINFALTAERLRQPYFLRWMLDPPRIEPAAKMPKFADEMGSTPFRDVLNGDARRQFEAIWVYLESLRN
jgi:cytochrome c551/c552